MARTPHTTDYAVDVEGIGTFVFGRRQMRDEIKSQVEFARLTEGAPVTQWLDVVCSAMADLKVFTVSAPTEFQDLDALDPLDKSVYAKLVKVHKALLEKERSFRLNPNPPNQASGPPAG